MKNILLRLAAMLTVVGLASTAASAPASAVRSSDDRCPVSASVCRYQLPADILEARKACFKAEREARGIPGSRGAYVAWWNAHEGTKALRDWNAAYQACQNRYPLPGGKWAWNELVFVGSR